MDSQDRGRNRGILVAAVLLLSCASLSHAAGFPAGPLDAGRDITVKTVTPSGQTHSLPPSAVGDVVVKSRPVTVNPGDSVSSLLNDAGIHPDASAQGLVLDLNPDMDSVDRIAAGTEVTMPVVEAPEFPPDPASRQAFRLEVDAKAKQELRSSQAELLLALEEFERSPTVIDSRPEFSDAVSGAAERARLAVRHFDLDTAVLPQATLRSLDQNTLDTLDFVRATTSQQGALGSVQAASVITYLSGTESFIMAIAGGEVRDVRVVVRIWDSDRKDQQRGYKVWYRPGWQKTGKKPNPLGPLTGAPAKGNLFPGPYIMWGEKRDSKGKVFSKTHKSREYVPYQEEEEFLVELMLSD